MKVVGMQMEEDQFLISSKVSKFCQLKAQSVEAMALYS